MTVKTKKDQHLNLREIGLINSRLVDGLLILEVEKTKKGSILQYNADGLIVLSRFLTVTPMDKRLFAVILRNIVSSAKEVSVNHFNTSLINWGITSSFIDPVTLRVYLMYIPVQPYETKCTLKLFLMDLVDACKFAEDEDLGIISEFVTVLRGSVSYTANNLEAFCDRLTHELLVLDSVKKDTVKCRFCGSDVSVYEDICPYCGRKAVDHIEKHIPEEGRSGSGSCPVTDEEKVRQRTGAYTNLESSGVVTVFKNPFARERSVWLEDRRHPGKIILSKFPFRVGRAEEKSDYVVDSRFVGEKHAEFLREMGKYYIKDLGSACGTLLNGMKLQPGLKEELHDGAYISMADREFKIHID